MSRFADTPKPPYYVVTFSSVRTEIDESYGDMATEMVKLAAQQPGYLGVESARDSEGFGITNSFWADEASIIAWKRVADHLAAQKLGREKWYERYITRVARVERAYGFEKS
jgi:heme-degrading monooxygenase HmoA